MQAALLRAALKRKPELVSRLLQQGADINTLDRRGRTPLWRASEKGNEQVVRILLEAGAAQCADEDLCTPTWVAAANGNVQTLHLLFAHGATHAPKNNDASPLWCASRYGHAKAIDALIHLGATHEAAANPGTTPLEAAMLHGHPSCLPALVAGGALEAAGRNAPRTARRAADMWVRSHYRGSYAREDVARMAVGLYLWPSALEVVTRAFPFPDVVTRVVSHARDTGAAADLDVIEPIAGGAAMSDHTLVEAARCGFLSAPTLVRAVAQGRRDAHTVARVLPSASPARYEQLLDAAEGGPSELRFVLRPSRQLARQVAPACTRCSIIALHDGLLPAGEAEEAARTLYALRLPHMALHVIASCLFDVESGFPLCS